LAALITFTIVSEFIRGGRVISRHTGTNLLVSMVQLGHRNTRRYGGYIVHFAIALMVIGFAGAAFNQSQEQEMGYGDSLQLGGYTFTCRSYTQDDNPNYGSESAILDVSKYGRQVDTLYPERRFYKSSQQTSTMPSISSSLRGDLYAVYEGQNPDSGKPILKIHINPLVIWIWIGAIVLILGTVLALVPNAAPVRATTPARVQTAPVGAGD
jgi:cytochrome c-type biogenesis protein CcmF